MPAKIFQELDLRIPALLQGGAGIAPGSKRVLGRRSVAAKAVTKDQPRELKKLLK